MRISYDPTINLGHLISILSFSLLSLGAYYDLKSDVRNNRTVMDARVEQQRLIDAIQDQRVLDMRQALQNSTDQINKKLDFIQAPRK